jgi:hypothetical protein
LAGNVVKRQTKKRKTTGKKTKNGRKKAEKKKNEAPISIDFTAYFARKIFEKMALSSRRNKTKKGALKTKSALGPSIRGASSISIAPGGFTGRYIEALIDSFEASTTSRTKLYF